MEIKEIDIPWPEFKVKNNNKMLFAKSGENTFGND